MVVSLTSNISLSKPSESELAAKWVNFTKLQEANNLIITDKTDINTLTYTPTIVGTTLAPSLGTGLIKVDYWLHMGMVWGNIVVEFSGGTVTVGNGEYGISLPLLVDNVFHSVGTGLTAAPGQYSVIGEGNINDASASNTSGLVAIDAVTIAGVSYARLITEAHTSPVKTSRIVRDSMPFAVTGSDRFNFNFCYKWM